MRCKGESVGNAWRQATTGRRPRGIVLPLGVSSLIGLFWAVPCLAETALPPFVSVSELGGAARQSFPVQGGIPLPPGALEPRDLDTLHLLDPAGRPVPAQFDVGGRWLDGSVKWLLLDFPSSQKAGSKVRYQLSRAGDAVRRLPSLATKGAGGVEVDTGPLRARFGKGELTVDVRGADGRLRTLTRKGIVSSIRVRRRYRPTARRYELDLGDAVVETNGPQRAVLKVSGWHVAPDGDRFSPSVVRLTFYRGQPFVRVHHTFVMSEDPDTHLLSDIALELDLEARPHTATFETARGELRVEIGGQRVSVFQENTFRPRYPQSYQECEFEGRFRVFRGEDVLVRGERYPGAVTLEGQAMRLGVYLRDCWQLSPKAVTYEPENATLRIGLYPGSLAGDLDLRRTEIRAPEHYRKYREAERGSWGKYTPTYVPHDLLHSALGISRTHEVVLWFAGDARAPGPAELRRIFEEPFVPFVSGEWNVSTGVLGKEAGPGTFLLQEAEATSRRMVAEVRASVERGGWYGLLVYGNVRYGWDKTHNRWMKYNPKYSWYHAGHLMNGGTLTQALWFHYLRHGDPRDYRLAEARGRQVIDLSVVHYHDQEEWVGAMLRHGGPDPWIGHRKIGGGHYPLAGLPIHYFVTGYERAADTVHLLGKTNYRHRNFDLGRSTDTDLANMTLHYEFTHDRRYYDRAVECVDHYYRHREEAARELTFFNYFTTAARRFHDICEEPEVRHKLRTVFLDRYRFHLEERKLPGNPEMAAFAYELEPGAEAARRIAESVETFVRQGSGQIGWYDNMLLVSPNELPLINAVSYAGHWLSRASGHQAAPPEVDPDGGTFPHPVDVSMVCETPGATIRYTLDGSEPTGDSTPYEAPIRIEADSLLRARAFQPGRVPSESVVADFSLESRGFSREGLAAWYRSDRGVRRVDSRIVRWADQSGKGRHALAGRRWAGRRAAAGVPEKLASAPLILPDAVKGFPVLRGEPGCYLRLRRYIPLRGDCTIAFVCSAEAGDSGPVLGDGDDGNIRIENVPRGALSVRFNVGVPGVRARIKTPRAPGEFSFWTVTRRGTRALLHGAGELLATKRLPDITPMNVQVLLGRRVWTDFFRSELCELLVWERALREDERVEVDAYLKRRYGPFESLPLRPTGAADEESREVEELLSETGQEEEEGEEKEEKEEREEGESPGRETPSSSEETPSEPTRKPLVRVVDLDVGESRRITLSDGSEVDVKLIELRETRDDLRDAVRRAVVHVEVDGERVELTSATYRLPVTVGRVRIDCSVTKGYTKNPRQNKWALEKDVRLRLWPAGSPLLRPGTFVYPARQRWFATDTQMANVPTFVDGGEVPGGKNIYYHYGLDIGGAEGMVDVVAATSGLVVSVGTDVLPGHEETPVNPRYDVVYLEDERGWYYRYSHLKRIEADLRPGKRVEIGRKIGVLGKEGGSGGWSHLHFDISSLQPSGEWGIQEGYAFLWEAYLRQYEPRLIAVARPHHVARTGEKVTLDASRSWSAGGEELRYEWTFGDGTKASGPRVERVYESPGEYSEVLEVTDPDGNVDYDFAVVQVFDRRDPQRLATIHAAYAPTFDIRPGDPVTFKVRTFRTRGGEIWDFGDGSPRVPVTSDGNAEVHAEDGYAATVHRFAKPRDYVVRVEHTDENGIQATAHLHVKVEPKARR